MASLRGSRVALMGQCGTQPQHKPKAGSETQARPALLANLGHRLRLGDPLPASESKR
jgi:hypothetical protein